MDQNRNVYVADDSSEQLLLISVWHDLASAMFEELQKPGALNTIIHLTDLQSRIYNDYSLATTMSSIFNLHPERERASSLRQWFEVNAEVIKARKLQVRAQIPLAAPTNVTSIHDALSKKATELVNGQLLRIRTKVPEFREADLKISTGCKHCSANPPDGYGLQYTCKSCGNITFPEANTGQLWQHLSESLH